MPSLLQLTCHSRDAHATPRACRLIHENEMCVANVVFDYDASNGNRPTSAHICKTTGVEKHLWNRDQRVSPVPADVDVAASACAS